MSKKKKKMSGIYHLEDRIPRGDSPEGFFDKDTGVRDVAILHPSRTEAAQRLQLRYDVYIWRLTPPHSAYICPRYSWEAMYQGMQRDLERFIRG